MHGTPTFPHRLPIARERFDFGPVAWPTLLLTLASVAAWCLTLGAALGQRLPSALGVLLLSLEAYVIFTGIHEAVHGSLSRSPALNAIIGNVAAVCLGPTASFRAYKYLHIQHHTHTNDRTRDPDFWSGGAPLYVLPLCWFSTDLYYMYFYLRAGQSRPARERWEVTGMSVLLLGAFAALCCSGWARPATLYWFLPGRLAAGALAFTFNYLPHIPYRVTAAEDPIRATNVIGALPALLTPLFMFHNYHLVHHLFPGIPFYRYPEIWRRRRAELEARGARVLGVRDSARPHVDPVESILEETACPTKF